MDASNRTMLLLWLSLFVCSSFCDQLSVVDFYLRQTSGNDYFQRVAMASSAPIATGNIAENTTFNYFNTDHSVYWNGNVSVSTNRTLSSRIIYDTTTSKVVLGFTASAATLNYETDLGASTQNSYVGGGNDIVLAFFTYAGVFLNQARYGTTNDEQLFGLTSDFDGIYAGGIYSISGSVGGPTLPSSGDTDMWIAMYDHSGNHIWSTSFGGTLADTLADIESDGSSYLYVAGNFNSPSIDCIGSGLVVHTGSFQNGILAQFDKNGSCVNAIRGLGTEDIIINAIAIEEGSSPNRIYIVGSGANATFDGITATGNTQDAFIFRFNPALSAAWGIAIGSNSDNQQGLDIYASLGTIFMLGSYQYPFNYSNTNNFTFFSNSSSRPSAFISQHSVLDGQVTAMSQVSFDQFDLVPHSVTLGIDGVLVLGGSIQGSGTLSGQPLSTQQKDAVVLFLVAPSPSPSGTPAPSSSPSASLAPSHSPTPTASSSLSTSSAASLSATPTPSIITGPEDSSSVPVAVVAGSAAAAGSGCTIIVVVGLVFWCRKKKKHDDDTSEEEDDDLTPVELS